MSSDSANPIKALPTKVMRKQAHVAYYASSTIAIPSREGKRGGRQAQSETEAAEAGKTRQARH